MQKLVMLTKTDEFSSVFSFRKRVSQHFITLHYLPKNKQEQDKEHHALAGSSKETIVRVGFVVAKRVAKRAVDRNYMRRVLRMLCRQQLALVSVDVDLIIQVHKPFINADYETVSSELASLLAKMQKRTLDLQARDLQAS